MAPQKPTLQPPPPPPLQQQARAPTATTANGGSGGESSESAELRAEILATLQEPSHLTWDSVAGLDKVKSDLNETMVLPVRAPGAFQSGMGRTPSSGILLYGAPGTGKTEIARVAASECGATFFLVSSSNLLSKWQGQSERLMALLFAVATERKPSIIFFDEFDSICPQRGEGSSESSRRMLTEFLQHTTKLDHLNAENPQLPVMVLAATNHPWHIDEAALRRFQSRILVPMPNAAGRAEIFRIYFRKNHKLRHCIREPEDFAELAALTALYSGSDIATVCKDAAMAPIRELQAATHFCASSEHQGKMVPCGAGVEGAIEAHWSKVGDVYVDRPITLDDIKLSLQHKPSAVTQETLKKFDEWTRKFGVVAHK